MKLYNSRIYLSRDFAMITFVAMRLILPTILITILIGCSSTLPKEQFTQAVDTKVDLPEPAPIAEPSPKYPGVVISDVFPVLESSSLLDDNGAETHQTISIAGFNLLVEKYVPISLSKDGSPTFKFKRFREPNGYWSFAAGISHLRGVKGKEIYTEIGGPGGVCCTNYSIIDISETRPRTIFNSEDFGNFRNEMEIFDFDRDGIYELMQWDSCMRYFRDDCGSCSPETRVYFKYRNDLGKYWPAKGIAQDFVKIQLVEDEKWLHEKFEEWTKTRDLALQLELHRTVLEHVVELLHIGDERRAWVTFEKFADVVDNDDRREIKKRLAECKFYIALRSNK